MSSNEEKLGYFFGIVIGTPFAILFIWTIINLKIVRHKEVIIVERWGKFYKRLDAGLHFLIPIMDRARTIVWRETEVSLDNKVQIYPKSFQRIDMRQNVMDFPLQTIITRDNVEIGVHPMLLYELVDPIRIAYETYDLNHAVEKLVQTTLRSIIGDMGLDDTLASREEINRAILQKIDHICFNWGIRICRVELLEIVPTLTIQEAMHQQLAAERTRRAVIVTAEGYREKTKTEAEGDCQAVIALATGTQQSTVIRAKAIADASVLIARAEADALMKIAESLTDLEVDATQYMVALRYIDMFGEVASNAGSRKIILPVETGIVGATSLMIK